MVELDDKMSNTGLTEQAVAQHRQGNLAEASHLYQAVLDAEPGNANARHMLGVVRLQQGRLDEAVALISEALALAPDAVDALCDGGVVLQLLNRFNDAIGLYDRALALRPADPETLLRRAEAKFALQRHDEALRDCNAAIALRPAFAEALQHRGSILLACKRFDDAIVAFDRAIALDADASQAHNLRGNALLLLGRFPEAVAAYGDAISRQPGEVAYHYNRGAARVAMGLHDLALTDFDKALSIRSDYAEAHLGRAHSLVGMRRYDDATSSYEKAVSNDPNLPFAPGFLGLARGRLCDWSHYDDSIRSILEGIRGGRLASVPFALLVLADAPAEQLACATEYVRNQYPATPLPPRRHGAQRSKLRIAYLSSTFYEHPGTYLIAELFEQHDRSRFELTGISFGPEGSGVMRSRVKAAMDRFVDVRLQSNIDVANLLRELEVDIAVDLRGHSQDARTGILAYRPAPVQVNFLGYPGTMGAEFIDYIVADPFVVPAGRERFYTEKVVRLPDCYQPNDTKKRIAERTPSRLESGLPERGFVFCSFNNSFKLSPRIFDVWMRLLRQVEGSVLWLLETSAAVKGNLRREAERRAVGGERLVFAPRVGLAEHLARHRLADLFLDSLPYNAHTTASDALWVGLPVVTCAGQTFAARVAGSLLRAVGLPELVTQSLDAYEALALELAGDSARLARLQEQLAQNRTTAPLFDIERYRRHLEAAYETMWERHSRGEPPRAFDVPPAAR